MILVMHRRGGGWLPMSGAGRGLGDSGQGGHGGLGDAQKRGWLAADERGWPWFGRLRQSGCAACTSHPRQGVLNRLP